ncbi:MAG: type II toxin-antitoxin system Phd/YefM family antitoxin [Betaproteobacteria bacterium]|nr:MAG: type II toxin-antitoxin system Phd/YefM family antitoxin [Betaproteobacteria bacterium]
MAGNSVNIHQAKTQLSKLVERAAAGSEIVITKAGKPMAKLVPLVTTNRVRKLGILKGKIKIPDDFDAPLPAKVIAGFEGR